MNLYFKLHRIINRSIDFFSLNNVTLSICENILWMINVIETKNCVYFYAFEYSKVVNHTQIQWAKKKINYFACLLHWFQKSRVRSHISDSTHFWMVSIAILWPHLYHDFGAERNNFLLFPYSVETLHVW